MERFPKSARVLKSEDFARNKRQGLRVRAGVLLVNALAGSVQRLGVIVSRKTGSAVERNRIKRVLRELFRRNRELFPAGDVVVVACEGAGKVDNAQLRAYMMRALTRLKEKRKVPSI